MSTIAIILAAGSGSRFSAENPKQYAFVNEKTVLRHAVEKFLTVKEIDNVIVVIREQDIELYKNSTLDLNLLSPVIGGPTRQASVNNALKALVGLNPKQVLIHDAARPGVNEHIIKDVINKLDRFNAVDVGINLDDTLKTKTDFSLHDRSKFYLTQTPQGFIFQDILKLHEQYIDENFTDDISLALKAGLEIGLVKGTKLNVKITTMDDLKYYEFMTKTNTTYIPRIGYGFDIHAFKESNNGIQTIRIGGIEIPFHKQFNAHSDGDVVLHAITDAILGALGEKDIGMLFSPHDERWRNANSTIFLEHANQLLIDQKGYISNIDITIVAEHPKLFEYKQLIKEKIASVLKIDSNRIAVKAKTSEKLGFVGREEGISVSAACLIMLPEE